MSTLIIESDVSNEFITPDPLYNFLNEEFGPFDLDVASTKEISKCKRFISPETDALTVDWDGKNIWCNPPYQHPERRKPPELEYWMRKAVKEIKQNNCNSVTFLVPAKVDCVWFHEYTMAYASEIIFLKGRLSFKEYGSTKKGTARFANMVVRFEEYHTNISNFDNYKSPILSPRFGTLSKNQKSYQIDYVC